MELSKKYFEQLGKVVQKEETIKNTVEKSGKRVHQCQACYTVYDTSYGDQNAGISAGTAFKDLPDAYTCPVCDGVKADFKPVELQING